MKTKRLTLLCLLAFLLSYATPSTQAFSDYSPEAIAADAIVVRPVCLAATIVGTAIFAVSLPFTLIAGKVGKTADSLIAKPARATFVRDMGDMSDLLSEE